MLNLYIKLENVVVSLCLPSFSIQLEMGKKEHQLVTLQGKVSELKQLNCSQDTPAKLQVPHTIGLKPKLQTSIVLEILL